MSQIIDTIKSVPGNITKLPTSIYNMATGSYYGVPVATFGLIGITSIALAYVTLMKDDEKNTSDTGLNDRENETSDDEYQEENNMDEPREYPREESREESREEERQEPRQMNGGKKKKSIKKRGKKNKKTIKKGKK